MIPYLQVENLTKSFGDLVLFHEISFGIAQGQRVKNIAHRPAGVEQHQRMYEVRVTFLP